MTNKEFFAQTVKAEEPTFLRVIKALPEDQLDYKPGDKARTAWSLAIQLAQQPAAISSAITKGTAMDESSMQPEEKQDLDMAASLMEKNFAELQKNLAAVSDEEWENGTSKLEFPGGKWETKKFMMAWGFLFDAVHHRGQLTAYLRGMGAKVPSVYGGSADEAPPGM